MHQRLNTFINLKNGGETICQWIFLVHHDMWCLWLMTKVLNDDLDEMWTCQWSTLFALFQILPSLHHMWRGHQEVGGFLDSQVTLNFENLKMTKPLTNNLNNNNNNNRDGCNKCQCSIFGTLCTEWVLIYTVHLNILIYSYVHLNILIYMLYI